MMLMEKMCLMVDLFWPSIHHSLLPLLPLLPELPPKLGPNFILLGLRISCPM